MPQAWWSRKSGVSLFFLFGGCVMWWWLGLCVLLCGVALVGAACALCQKQSHPWIMVMWLSMRWLAAGLLFALLWVGYAQQRLQPHGLEPVHHHKKKQPHDINKMPVPGDGLKSKMVVF